MAPCLSLFTVFIFLLGHALVLQQIAAKVFLVLMDDDAVISYRRCHRHQPLGGDDERMYRERAATGHDVFLLSLLPEGTYTKLYSYTHLLNGFAVHTTSDKILRRARGVRFIQEDVKMAKLTTHTPDYLGVTGGVWPDLGGPENAGEGVVIGMVDTGVNPRHPSFSSSGESSRGKKGRFRGECEHGDGFPPTACNGKIVGARHFARGAAAAGEFNATSDFASPFDPDGHGACEQPYCCDRRRKPRRTRHCGGFNYGYASGMAPSARIAVYRALYQFGGFMSDVVAAVDKPVFGPLSVPSGPAVYLSILDVALLSATKAGVVVVQAVGNGGPSSSSVLSFSPWILSVAASTIDRQYNNAIVLGNGRSIAAAGLSPPTPGEELFPMAAATDVSSRSTLCPSLVEGKIVICTCAVDSDVDGGAIKAAIADVMRKLGAAGFILVAESGAGSEAPPTVATVSIDPMWDYYNANSARGSRGEVLVFGARARITDGRHAVYTGKGPDVDNVLLQAADVLKPNVMAPGTSIWAAWSPQARGIPISELCYPVGTSMATPHVSGIAALIKQRYPHWSPAAISSALMTTARDRDIAGAPILAQVTGQLSPANPFDLGAGFVDPAMAMDPGLVFDAGFEQYVGFLCAVPGVHSSSVRRAEWSSDLNTASVAILSLVGLREVTRTVTSVANEREMYRVTVREPAGVSVSVDPTVFSIRPNSSRLLRISLEAREALRTFTFGELRLEGSRGHFVRVPIAVYVSSAMKP
ncbi:unnamed protein product [Spirodela intermedia]|uniref:Uncharacterized protein n=1 Tax=Spirodela intermedia TaxID=51605 RepID=A0A7I8IGY9_SPIIN|nr:unnamed protein product [Spirodela intermedia]CAA6657140.1 unnamed protein product [Spirodela intermedia]